MACFFGPCEASKQTSSTYLMQWQSSLTLHVGRALSASESVSLNLIFAQELVINSGTQLVRNSALGTSVTAAMTGFVTDVVDAVTTADVSVWKFWLGVSVVLAAFFTLVLLLWGCSTLKRRRSISKIRKETANVDVDKFWTDGLHATTTQLPEPERLVQWGIHILCASRYVCFWGD